LQIIAAEPCHFTKEKVSLTKYDKLNFKIL